MELCAGGELFAVLLDGMIGELRPSFPAHIHPHLLLSSSSLNSRSQLHQTIPIFLHQILCRLRETLFCSRELFSLSCVLCLFQSLQSLIPSTRTSQVEYYGTPVSLKSIAQISTPDSSSLVVNPYNQIQAVMASDFAIAQFRFLERRLVVHGHWCYKRIAQMVLSRLGRMSYDIVGAQILQTRIPASKVNLIGTTEVSVASLAESMMLGVAIIANDVSHFGILAVLSVYQ